MIITADNFPEIRLAFAEIEMDSGGHLIGTVYPGDPLNLNEFDIPNSCEHLCAPAEIGLKRLRSHSEEEWSTFICGDVDIAEEIISRQGDFEEANTLLNLYFDGFEPA
jgi:hypothetical protein